MCLLGKHNCAIANYFLCDVYDSPLLYSQKTQGQKGSRNLQCQGSVNIKGHTIKFALIQGPLCASSAYRQGT